MPPPHALISPIVSFQAVFSILLFSIFAMDIVVTFHLAYYEPKQRRLVTDLPAIRWRYIR